MFYSKLTKFLFSCWKSSNDNGDEYGSFRTEIRSGAVSRPEKGPDSGIDQFICEKLIESSWWAYGAEGKMLVDQAGIEVLWSIPQSDGSYALMDSDGCIWYDT